MKWITAFVRVVAVDDVARALREAGAPGVAVALVHSLGYGYDPKEWSLLPGELARAPDVARVELVCEDGAAERLVAAIVAAGRTGLRGDGIVFVSTVERAVRIRTGEEGSAALQP